MIEDPPPLTPSEELKWRAEFKRRGYAVVYEDARHDKFNPEKVERLAFQWLREQETAREWRERATFWIGVAILVLTIIGIGLTLAGLLRA